MNRQQQVIDALAEHGPMTRAEIAIVLDMPESQIIGAIHRARSKRTRLPIRICKYIPQPEGTSGAMTPVYQHSSLPDRSPPKPRDRNAICAAYRARKRGLIRTKWRAQNKSAVNPFTELLRLAA